MLVKTKWLAGVFIGLLIMTCSAGPVMAEQKNKLKGKRFGVVTDRTVHEVGDVKGHIIGIVDSEGVDILAKTT